MFKIIKYIIRFVPLIISTIIALTSVFPASLERLELDKAEQIERIAALEKAYANGEIAPVDESSFFDGDLDKELAEGIKFNELSFLATHNCYQSPSIDETKKLYGNLSELTFGLVSDKTGYFWSETLTDQLNSGLRSFEMDVEAFNNDGEISFTCMHLTYFEMATWCYDFALGLKEIAMWSDNNPNHMPITIIIEPKSTFIPLENMEKLNSENIDAFDAVIRDVLKDKLFTPADMLRDYDSFGEMRAADDWCKASDMRGKVLVLLHEGGLTEEYIEKDPSIKSQAMFPMLRADDIDRDCTSFILCNKPEELLEINDRVIKENKIIVRTRADKFTSVSDERRENALASDAQIVSTDYPVRTDLTSDSYVVSFGDRKTIRKIETD